MVARVKDVRVGPLLRSWRERRRLSQLDLALEANVSARHLSFVETGRSRPSAELVAHLAERLGVPLRDRNALLLAAGYAPARTERELDAPETAPVRQAIQRVLAGHEPYPALVVNQSWDVVAANHGLGLLTTGVAGRLLEPPVNALRLALAPDGMAPRIVNLGEWREHVFERLRRQVAATGDPSVQALADELAAYPGATAAPATNDIVVPLRLRCDEGELAFFSTVTTFGTPIDVMVAELAIEAFFPADDHTRQVVTRSAAAQAMATAAEVGDGALSDPARPGEPGGQVDHGADRTAKGGGVGAVDDDTSILA